MRIFSGLLVCLSAMGLFAQAPEDPDVARARLEVQRVKSLVDVGVAPPVQLRKAEEALTDAQDRALLHQSIFQQDLTEAKADEMVAAATRQFERRKKAFDEAEKLVKSGLAPELSLSTFLQDLNFASKECELAEARAKLAREMAQMAEQEALLQEQLAHAPAEAHSIAERYDGDGIFTPEIFRRIETAFASKFGKSLPVSANGETAVHRALGFDHRGRVDVAVHPDQPEGVWLRDYLMAHHIPFFAFRQAVPGKATGAHIHLGPISTRLAAGG